MLFLSLLLTLLVPAAQAGLQTPNVSTHFIKSAHNEVMLFKNQPLIWGVHPKDYDSSQPQFYQNVLSNPDGSLLGDWQLPELGQSPDYSPSRYDVVRDVSGALFGVLRVDSGFTNEPILHFELHDFLTGQNYKTTELQPRPECTLAENTYEGAYGPLYLTLSTGIFFVRFCPLTNSNDVLAELVELRTGQSTAQILNFTEDSDCTLVAKDSVNPSDVTAICWPKNWDGSASQFVSAHELFSGKIAWKAAIPGSVFGMIYLREKWALPGGDAAVLFETSGGNDDYYLFPAGPVKQAVRVTGGLDLGIMSWHPQVGLKNGMPQVFGFGPDESSGTREYRPASLSLVTGRATALSYVPWKLFSFKAGEVYAVAPSADEKTFSVINTSTDAEEVSFKTPYTQSFLFGDYYPGRNTGSIVYGEAHDGLVQAADKVYFWSAEPNSWNSQINEMTMVELRYQ